MIWTEGAPNWKLIYGVGTVSLIVLIITLFNFYLIGKYQEKGEHDKSSKVEWITCFIDFALIIVIFFVKWMAK